MMRAHEWGEPDSQGMRTCLREGCYVRVHEAKGEWQLRRGYRKVHWARVPIPECYGKEMIC